MYHQVLCIARDEPAVAEGQTYDLMYANPQLSDRQFAFLRKCRNELLIIVTNFAKEAVESTLSIPHHAFEFMQIAQTEAAATDLLSGAAFKLLLYADSPICCSLPANGAIVLKVVL
jgi:hypothetical protein